MSTVTIRSYEPTDYAAVVALFSAHVPDHFAASEIVELESYLTHQREDYFVALAAGQVIGAAGINYHPTEARAVFSWDAVHPDWQGGGVGSQLVVHRLRHLRQQSGWQTVTVRTSQTAQSFYARQGFSLRYVRTHYWAPGFDLYFMEMNL